MRYIVILGEDEFLIEATSNQNARYEGASLFKTKHNLDYSLPNLVFFAKATQVRGKRVPNTAILKILKTKDKNK